MASKTKEEKILTAACQVFKAIGYYAFPENEDTFYIYNKDTSEGLCYIGTVSPIIKGNTINSYKDKEYDNILKMIEDMKEDNEKLPFPSNSYCPMMRTRARFSEKIDWYMRKVLHFSKPNFWKEHKYYVNGGDSFILRNIYDEIKTNIIIFYNEKFDTNVEEDKISGRVVGEGFSWIETPFVDIEACIAAIDGMIEPELLVDIVSDFEVVDSMTGSRNYTGNLMQSNGITAKAKSIKERTKQLLQDALAKLG